MLQEEQALVVDAILSKCAAFQLLACEGKSLYSRWNARRFVDLCFYFVDRVIGVDVQDDAAFQLLVCEGNKDLPARLDQEDLAVLDLVLFDCAIAFQWLHQTVISHVISKHILDLCFQGVESVIDIGFNGDA